MQKTAIVFSPHPDDETFGCGGTIAKRVKEGYEVLVVVLTDGRHAFSNVLNNGSIPRPEELSEIRKEEVRKALSFLGVEEKNLILLDFEDGTLMKNKEKAFDRIVEILTRNAPVEVYFPYEKDCHPDHRATNRILRCAIKEVGISPVKYRYSIIRTHSRVGPFIDALFGFFRRNRVHVDISKFICVKTQAARAFRSEVSIISSNQREPVLTRIKRFLKKDETFFIDE